ncbi:MAG: response regulator transcription factor [Actinomycetes bacterium]
MSIRLVLVDDHTLIRQGLTHAFARDSAVEVVAEAGTTADAARLVATLRPDVVLVDVTLPDGNGLDLAADLRKADSELGLVVLTMHGDDENLFRALDAGVSAFVLKSAPVEEVLAAVRHAAMAPTSFMANDLAGAMRRRMHPGRPLLTVRESEVLDLLKDGLSVASVARRMYISESTAKSHIAKLYSKLGAGNRTQAIMAALRLGLIRQEDSKAGAQ